MADCPDHPLQQEEDENPPVTHPTGKKPDRDVGASGPGTSYPSEGPKTQTKTDEARSDGTKTEPGSNKTAANNNKFSSNEGESKKVNGSTEESTQAGGRETKNKHVENDQLQKSQAESSEKISRKDGTEQNDVLAESDERERTNDGNSQEGNGKPEKRKRGNDEKNPEVDGKSCVVEIEHGNDDGTGQGHGASDVLAPRGHSHTKRSYSEVTSTNIRSGPYNLRPTPQKKTQVRNIYYKITFIRRTLWLKPVPDKSRFPLIHLIFLKQSDKTRKIEFDSKE